MSFTKGRSQLRRWALLLAPLVGAVACTSNPSGEPDAAALGHEGEATAVGADPEVRAGFTTAVSLMRQQRWGAAEEVLGALRQEHPGYSGAALNLGIVYLRTDRAQQAEQAFRSAIALNAANADARNHLGALLRQAGRFAEAKAQYQAALAVAPTHADSHLNLGILCDLYLGDLTLARRHYQAYQSAQAQPDARVRGWIADIERRETLLGKVAD